MLYVYVCVRRVYFCGISYEKTSEKINDINTRRAKRIEFVNKHVIHSRNTAERYTYNLIAIVSHFLLAKYRADHLIFNILES